jgi:AcrR family transcriptional regulator
MPETRRRSAPATRAAILEAARNRFGTHGFDRVRLRDVAADVGVDPAMVIRYFGTKDSSRRPRSSTWTCPTSPG